MPICDNCGQRARTKGKPPLCVSCREEFLLAALFVAEARGGTVDGFPTVEAAEKYREKPRDPYYVHNSAIIPYRAVRGFVIAKPVPDEIAKVMGARYVTFPDGLTIQEADRWSST